LICARATLANAMPSTNPKVIDNKVLALETGHHWNDLSKA